MSNTTSPLRIRGASTSITSCSLKNGEYAGSNRSDFKSPIASGMRTGRPYTVFVTARTPIDLRADRTTLARVLRNVIVNEDVGHVRDEHIADERNRGDDGREGLRRVT